MLSSRTKRKPLALWLSSTDIQTEVDDPGNVDIVERLLKPESAISWAFDFRCAEDAGMAVRIEMSEDEFISGLDLLLVFGIASKTTLESTETQPLEAATKRALEDLIEHHQFTRGFAFVAQGTPTNNTESVSSGYTTDDLAASASEIPGCDSPLIEDLADGRRFFRALGLNTELAANTAGANRRENWFAEAMARVLWPTTMGFFMHNLRSETISGPSNSSYFRQEEIALAREYFVNYVRGRGPFAAFRVGDVPYGLLPVTHIAFDIVEAGKTQADYVFEEIGTYWPTEIWSMARRIMSVIDQTPRIGRLNDPNDDLFGTLRTNATAANYYIRRNDGAETLNEFINYIQATITGVDLQGLRSFIEIISEGRVFAVPRDMLPPKYYPTPDGTGVFDPSQGFPEQVIQLIPVRPNEAGNIIPERPPIEGIEGELTPESFDPFSQGTGEEGFPPELTEGVPHELVDPIFFAPPGTEPTGVLEPFSTDIPIEHEIEQPHTIYPDETLTPVQADVLSISTQLIRHSMSPEGRSELQEEVPQSLLDILPQLGDRVLLVPRPDDLQDVAEDRLLLVPWPFELDRFQDTTGVSKLIPWPDNIDTLQGDVLIFVYTPELPEWTSFKFDPDALFICPVVPTQEQNSHSSANDPVVSDDIGWISNWCDHFSSETEGSSLLFWMLCSAIENERLQNGNELTPEFRDCLARLGNCSSAELELLLGETLGVCSHRIDAWLTSWATLRLEKMRTVNSEGSYIGAYGWVVDIRLDSSHFVENEAIGGTGAGMARSDSGGYIYAPSMRHGSAAAVLRSAYLARTGEGSKPYAINLSSARVRTALSVLDSVRQGQPLGAILGYIFERGIHENRSEIKLDHFIDDFRLAFGSFLNESVRASGPTESLAARTVVDGYELVEKWRNHKEIIAEIITTALSKIGDLSETEREHQRSAIESELTELDKVSDMVADLLLAESVYQIVGGNTAATNATLDAMSRGGSPPDPEIASIPRGSASLFHRISLYLASDIHMENAWSQIPLTPRANTEPRLNIWVGDLLGNPGVTKCQAIFKSSQSDANRLAIDVALSELQVQPLDILALATLQLQAGSPMYSESLMESLLPMTYDSELTRRIFTAAQKKLPADSLQFVPIAIDFDNSSDLPASSLSQILELSYAINNVLGSARPLEPRDLLLPQDERLAAMSADLMVEETARRADDAAMQLAYVIDELQNTLQRAQSETSNVVTQQQLLQILGRASLFGVAFAFPATSQQNSLNIQLGIDVLAELRQRSKASDIVLEQLNEAITHIASEMRDVNTERLTQALASKSLSAVIEVFGIDPFIAESASLEQLASALNTQLLEPSYELEVALIAQAVYRVKAIFGGNFSFIPRFKPANGEALQQALDSTLDLGEDADHTISVWITQVARVRKSLDLFRRLGLYAGAMGRPFMLPQIIQLPHRENARWAGLQFEGDRPAAGQVSLAFYGTNRIHSLEECGGLLLEEWVELIPNPTETAGVVYHYDSPGAEAPQALLLAVPPSAIDHWNIDLVCDILLQALKLAKIRAMDGEYKNTFQSQLPKIGFGVYGLDNHATYDQWWPMIYLTTTEQSDDAFKACIQGNR